MSVYECDVNPKNKTKDELLGYIKMYKDTIVYFNKGIDDLIKNYEDKLKVCGINFEPLLKTIIQDLKKLK